MLSLAGTTQTQKEV